jgi:hypothetical protein
VLPPQAVGTVTVTDLGTTNITQITTATTTTTATATVTAQPNQKKCPTLEVASQHVLEFSNATASVSDEQVDYMIYILSE